VWDYGGIQQTLASLDLTPVQRAHAVAPDPVGVQVSRIVLTFSMACTSAAVVLATIPPMKSFLTPVSSAATLNVTVVEPSDSASSWRPWG
jgi:hypothetical protein